MSKPPWVFHRSTTLPEDHPGKQVQVLVLEVCLEALEVVELEGMEDRGC